MTAFANALAAAYKAADQLKGITVTYSSGGNSVTLLATPAETQAELLEGEVGDAVSETSRMRDWLIDPALLLLNSLRHDPLAGDSISYSEGGVSYVWKVRPLDARQPPWRWTSAEQTRRRVHTLLESRT